MLICIHYVYRFGSVSNILEHFTCYHNVLNVVRNIYFVFKRLEPLEITINDLANI